jgi:hypothetical protein
MKLIKLHQGMSVVEIPNENCEEPVNGSTAVFIKQNGETFYEDGRFFVYSDELYNKLESLKNIQIVTCHYWESDWDRDIEQGHNIEEKSAFEMLFPAYDDYILDDIKITTDSVEKIVEYITNGTSECDYVGFCMTKEEYDKMEAEKLRKSLEQTAAQFAAECGHPVGSIEYVNAAWDKLEEALSDKENAFSGEAQMERFAACRFAGCSDSYWSDEDYLQSKYNEPINQLDDVLQWLENNFPLLMLQAREAREKEELAVA